MTAPVVNLRFTTSFPRSRPVFGLTKDVTLVNRSDFYDDAIRSVRSSLRWRRTRSR